MHFIFFWNEIIGIREERVLKFMFILVISTTFFLGKIGIFVVNDWQFRS